MVEQLGREVTDAEVANAMEIEEHQVSFLSERGKAAKSALVRANMRLVFHMAKYYRFRGLSYPDLVQEGTFGLMKAVDRYVFCLFYCSCLRWSLSLSIYYCLPAFSDST
jgi:DNA-directed RNA polymerase sigma subunit (sigma70/sigma32)